MSVGYYSNIIYNILAIDKKLLVDIDGENIFEKKYYILSSILKKLFKIRNSLPIMKHTLEI